MPPSFTFPHGTREFRERIKFVGEALINGSNRTQWIFAAPDNAKAIRISVFAST